MDMHDTCEYVRHRLRIAGGDDEIFSPSALNRIYRYSGGLPRLINVLCGRALLLGFSRDSKIINARMISAAIKEVGFTRKSWVHRMGGSLRQ
jgi:general secretion pathway protein A